jgi:hypothetical protein
MDEEEPEQTDVPANWHDDEEEPERWDGQE